MTQLLEGLKARVRALPLDVGDRLDRLVDPLGELLLGNVAGEPR